MSFFSALNVYFYSNRMISFGNCKVLEYLLRFFNRTTLRNGPISIRLTLVFKFKTTNDGTDIEIGKIEINDAVINVMCPVFCAFLYICID